MNEHHEIFNSNKIHLNITQNLICPNCASKLENINDKLIMCKKCNNKYSKEKNKYSFIQNINKIKDEENYKLWKETQNNGFLSYTKAPELNLSNKSDIGVKLFRSKVKLHNKVLDIGCGPQKHIPNYILSDNIKEYIGIDPLSGNIERDFTFIQGYGEHLPFTDNYFNNVVIYSALDHFIDYKKVIAESHRVLNNTGHIYLMVDFFEEEEKTTFIQTFLHLVKRGSSQIFRGIKLMGLRRTLAYFKTMLTMRIPKGAKDYFHTQFPTINEITNVLKDNNFEIINKYPIEGECIIHAKKL